MKYPKASPGTIPQAPPCTSPVPPTQHRRSVSAPRLGRVPGLPAWPATAQQENNINGVRPEPLGLFHSPSPHPAAPLAPREPGAPRQDSACALPVE